MPFGWETHWETVHCSEQVLDQVPTQSLHKKAEEKSVPDQVLATPLPLSATCLHC